MAAPGFCVCPRLDSDVPHIKTSGCPPMKLERRPTRKDALEYLAGVAIAYCELGGRPDHLIRTPFKRQYRLLVQALEILEEHKAVGHVRIWMSKNGRFFSKFDR